MTRPDYHIVSFSGGKDSTAMLLHMLELGMQVDEIIFCDTGLEFPQMYEHIDKVERYIGRSITRVVPDKPFEYWFFEWDNRRDTSECKGQKGYSWATIYMRWCTAELKRAPLRKHYKGLKDKNIIEFVGIAADEEYRLKRKNQKQENKQYPLVKWGWSEKQCLQYCYDKGFDWGGIYKHWARMSCWCCPLQSLHNLKCLYRYFPNLWVKLKEWDNKTWRQFRPDYSVEQLEQKFKTEDLYAEMQGKLF